jgi:hypothetical protein
MPLLSSKLRMSLSEFRSVRASFLVLALVCFGGAVFIANSGPAAAEDKPPCEAFDWSIKREQALFHASDLRTVASGAALDALPERGIAMELVPHAMVKFAMTPERQPKTPDSLGGIVSVSNGGKPGTYQVTASTDAWLDVIQNGKFVASIAHSGRRDCPDVRKSVRFNLEAGPVAIQVSGSAQKVINLAVLPAE